MTANAPHVLIVNPWIHDFAAYDFWANPIGVLTLGSVLRRCGIAVSYVDCLDRFHPRAPYANPLARFGRGPYLKTEIRKPKGFEDVPRRFSRYGIRPQWLLEDLSAPSPPDLILVTSLMTYWWTGVRETLQVLKQAFPKTPAVLGGIYATLCPSHAARACGAERLLAGPGEMHVLELAAELTGRPMESLQAESGFKPEILDTWPYPALELQHKIPFVPLLTSVGCPFACPYCASHRLTPKRMRRSPGLVVKEIRFWHLKHGVRDFVLYDDAFLVDAKEHAFPVLSKIVSMDLPLRFHTPNALHAREITRPLAGLLKRAGFHTLRMGLETADREKGKPPDNKVTLEAFSQAAAYLLEAGFTKGQVGAYLLVGLPGQDLGSVRYSIQVVKACGIHPIPAYYSPIPQTPLWEAAVRSSRYPLESDPLFTNNAVLPCQKRPFSWETLTRIKRWCASA